MSDLSDVDVAELSAQQFDELTGIGDNRRKRERRGFSYLQWAAPCQHDTLPDRRSFRQIRCSDISRGGISYYTDRPPLDEYLVMGLGKSPNIIWVRCQISNCVRVDEEKGAFRIGCQFIERLELPTEFRPAALAAQAT